MITQVFRNGLLVLACIAPLATPAAARTAFDGTWSVLIITNQGSCDRAYRTGVQIIDGLVTSDAGGASGQGRVSPNGTVPVSVAAGGQSAIGSGRLSRSTGGGVWRGQGNTGVCAGTWQAERR